MPSTLTTEGVQALAVAALALLLFGWGRWRADVVAIFVMLVLILSGLVTPQEGVSGFAHEATVTVALMFVLAAGLLRTGAIDVLASWTTRMARGSELRLLLLTVGAVLPLSAFVNNTAAVAVMIPMVLSLSRGAHIAPSRLLMPVSFAAQLGGTLTLIGTSTNLLIAGLVVSLGGDRIALFDTTLPALFVCAVGVLYLFTAARWLLPHRTPDADLLHSYELHDYLTALRVQPDSKLASRSLGESRFGEAHGLQVVRIEREDGHVRVPSGSTIVRPGDLLLVEGKIGDIARIQREEGLDLAEVDVDMLPLDDPAAAVRFAELLVPRRSSALRRTLSELALRARYRINVVAVRRHGVALHVPLATVQLRPGDMLLVQGTREALRRVHAESEFILLGTHELPSTRRSRMKLAVPIVIGVVLLPAAGVTTILVAALAGVVAMILTGCITPDEAYREIDWMVIVLLGALIPLGQALHISGAAAFLAATLVNATSSLGPHGVLAGLLLLTTALTAIISNAAAAVVIAPVAIAIAAALGLSPVPFVIGIMIGASNSFLSPIGYQTNAMIMGPGGYHFGDYLRVGAPLSVLVIITAVFAIPLFYPF